MEVRRVVSEEDLKNALKIRKAVFVKEQGVPIEVERDGKDSYSNHVIVYHEGKAVATGRLRTVDDAAKLERICVMPEFRMQGFGKVVVKALEDIAIEKGIKKLKLHGQTHAVKFYEKLGYIKNSDEFLEESIPHYLMIKNI